MYVIILNRSCYFELFIFMVGVKVYEVDFLQTNWLNLLISVLAIFPSESDDNGSVSAESIQSHKQSHWAAACHPIIDSVIYEFSLYGTTEMLSPEPLWSNLNCEDKSASIFHIQ